MCGIWAYFLRHGNLLDATDYQRHEAYACANVHRGPDHETEVRGADYHLWFYRLAIHDQTHFGNQPFFFEYRDGTIMHLMCNGEIYNYDDLVEKYKPKLRSKSDCEIICHLLKKYDWDPAKVVTKLRGEYAFVARIEKPMGDVCIIAARDPYGVRPLYYGATEKGIAFSSMLGGIADLTKEIEGKHFPPGHTYMEWISKPEMATILRPFEIKIPVAPMNDTMEMYRAVTNSLIESVKVRLSSEREVGFLLSGGLDSSLVVAIAVKILGLSAPQTFSIGFSKDATDLAFAKKVALHLGTRHHEYIVASQQAIDSLPEVMRAIETYDTTTVRASTPQYLLAKYIRENTEIRVILNGDGSDEVASGYLYNYYAPDDAALHKDAVQRVKDIYQFDGLRVDRTLGIHGLEARVPFLDSMFVATYHQVPVELRRPMGQRMEKQFLRDAFATLYPDLLPKEVLYRQKEAFSDAVSSKTHSWYQILQDSLSLRISDEDFHRMREICHYLSPETKEMCYYRQTFQNFFGERNAAVVPYFWLPRWCGDIKEPSARVLGVYQN